MVICFLLHFADFSLIEIIISYRRFWIFVMGSYPGSWDSVSLRSFVNRTKRPSETRLSQVANISLTGTAVYMYIYVYIYVYICIYMCIYMYIAVNHVYCSSFEQVYGVDFSQNIWIQTKCINSYIHTDNDLYRSSLHRSEGLQKRTIPGNNDIYYSLCLHYTYTRWKYSGYIFII